jgi:phytoene dehydrogenase-like protein
MKADAIIIGSGPNGLAAAITLARAGWSVVVREQAGCVGGSTRSAALTLPGYTHDICSTVHALACASPFVRELPLHEHGLEFSHPSAPFAHPFDDGTSAVCERSIDATCATLGNDADGYRALMQPIVDDWEKLLPSLLGPPRWPKHPILLARFGALAIRSAESLVASHLPGMRAAALFAGAAAHSILPLDWAGTAAYGLVLTASAHTVGWPVARGGSQKLADALADHLTSLGGRIELSSPVRSIDKFSDVHAILCDVTPRQLLKIAGHALPPRYVRRLSRFQYGPGVFKLDWALDGPIPWRASECHRAGTIHIGGTFAEIAESETACWRGEHAPRPFVLLVQPTQFDSTRAPVGKHTAWAYCHVPNRSNVNMTDAIENQVDRFAPGFKKLILARHSMTCAEMEQHNPNLIGGDITGGAQTLSQVIRRPVLFPSPYVTPLPGLYLCSASTPPGGGVHGMCGFHAAQAALAAVSRLGTR